MAATTDDSEKVRTSVWLTKRQRDLLDAETRRTGERLSTLIRRAIDHYFVLKEKPLPVQDAFTWQRGKNGQCDRTFPYG